MPQTNLPQPSATPSAPLASARARPLAASIFHHSGRPINDHGAAALRPPLARSCRQPPRNAQPHRHAARRWLAECGKGELHCPCRGDLHRRSMTLFDRLHNGAVQPAHHEISNAIHKVVAVLDDRALLVSTIYPVFRQEGMQAAHDLYSPCAQPFPYGIDAGLDRVLCRIEVTYLRCRSGTTASARPTSIHRQPYLATSAITISL